MSPAGDTNQQQAVLKTGRIMWVMFLCAACALIAVSHMNRGPVGHPVPAPLFSGVIAAVAAVDIVVIAAIRRRLLLKSQDHFARAETAAANATWMQAQVLGFASGMSIVLFGFVVHTIGAPPAWISTAFYVAGLLVLAACRPQRPE